MRDYGEFRNEVIDVLKRGWFSTQDIADEIGEGVPRQQVRGCIVRLFDQNLIAERYGKRDGGEDKRCIEYTYSP